MGAIKHQSIWVVYYCLININQIWKGTNRKHMETMDMVGMIGIIVVTCFNRSTTIVNLGGPFLGICIAWVTGCHHSLEICTGLLFQLHIILYESN